MPGQDKPTRIKITTPDFDPLDVLVGHSEKIEILLGSIEVIQCRPKPGRIIVPEIYNVYVSKTDLGTFLLAVIKFKDADFQRPITKKTRFTVGMHINIPTRSGTNPTGRYTYKDVTAVDLLPCQLPDGTKWSVGLLCIPIKPFWDITSRSTPFGQLGQGSGKFKVCLAIHQVHPSDKEALPVKLNNWQIHKKNDGGYSLLMAANHLEESWRPLLTLDTPIEVELELSRNAPKASTSTPMPPYRISAIVQPWYVEADNTYVHGVLAIPISLENSTPEQARFFEEASKDSEKQKLKVHVKTCNRLD